MDIERERSVIYGSLYKELIRENFFDKSVEDQMEIWAKITKNGGIK